MRFQTARCTLSVVACLLLSCSALLTLARADPAPRPDHRPSLDSPYSPTGHHASPGSPTGDFLSAKESNGSSKTYREENWRHKALRSDGTVISDPNEPTAQDLSDTGIENSRFGSGNPRLQVKTNGRAFSLTPSPGKAITSPSNSKTSSATLPKPLQMSPISDDNKNTANYSNGLISSHSEDAQIAEVSLTLPREQRMYGDSPAVGLPVERSPKVSSSNTSHAGSISNGANGDMTVYPSPRKEFYQDDIQLGCRELRARRYITDGFCTSEDPIKEVVCAGSCLPIKEVPWYAEFIKTMAKNKLREWQCVDDFTRRKRVRLLCQDGSLRTYRIKVVKSCRCERVGSKGNRTSPSKRRRKGKRRKRKDKNMRNRNKKKRNRRRRKRKNKKSNKSRPRGESKGATATNSNTGKAKTDKSRSEVKKQSGS